MTDLNNPTQPTSTTPPPQAPPTTTTEPPPRKRGGIGRVIKWLVLIVLVLLIGGGIALYLNLNGIVRRTVQDQATQQLGVQTTLGGANVGLFSGNVALNDLQISSPNGFAAPKMFTLGGTKVDVSYGQLRADPKHVESITIDAPKLVIEQSGGQFNFKALMDQMPKGEPKTEDPNQKPMKLIIDKLRVNNPTVVVRPGNLSGIAGATGLKLPEELTLAIPSIEMSDVGSGEGNQNGAALMDVVMTVITTMAAKASDSDQLPPELKQLMHLNLKDVTANLSEVAKSKVASVVGDATKNLPGNVGSLVQQASTNPSAILNDPKKALQQNLPQNLPKDVPANVKDGLGGVLGGLTGNKAANDNTGTASQSTTTKKKKPATAPAK